MRVKKNKLSAITIIENELRINIIEQVLVNLLDSPNLKNLMSDSNYEKIRENELKKIQTKYPYFGINIKVDNTNE